MAKNLSRITMRSAQTLLRSNHERLIMESLLNGPKSCSDIARLFAISNTAAKLCVSELLSIGLIKREPESLGSSHYGRHPIKFTINASFGLLAVIALGIDDNEILIHDLFGSTILDRHVKGSGAITSKTLSDIKETLSEMVSSLNEGDKLLRITISTPGKLDSSGHYFFARHIENYSSIDYPSFFASFGVPVSVYRDTNLGCLGARASGAITSEDKNVYYAYIGYEAGGSLLLDGSIYHGSHGFAGECSSFEKMDEESSSSTRGSFVTLTDIENNLGPSFKGIESIKEGLLKGEAKAIDEVRHAAKEDALELLSIVNLLDVDLIVVSGPIFDLGCIYNDTLMKCFKEYDANKSECVLRISSTKNPFALGALHQGRNDLLSSIFASLAEERNNKNKKIEG